MPELKHIKCKLEPTGCGYELESGCREEIKKAYEFDKVGFGEWVGDEFLKRVPSGAGNLITDYQMGQIFKETTGVGDAALTLMDRIGRGRITFEQIWDTLCEAAKDFNERYEEE